MVVAAPVRSNLADYFNENYDSRSRKKSSLTQRFNDGISQKMSSLPKASTLSQQPEPPQEQGGLVAQQMAQSGSQSVAAPDIQTINAQNPQAQQEEIQVGSGALRAPIAAEMGEMTNDPIADMGKAQNRLEATKRAEAAKLAAQQQQGTNTGSALLSGVFEGDGSGSGLDGEQLQYARMIANIGRSRGFSDIDIQTAMATALAESEMRNINYGDRDSVGLFQQRTSQGWGSIQDIMNPTYSINKFYDALSKAARGANPWNTAQNVQRSFDPTGSNYQARWGTAQAAFRSIYGGAMSSPTVGSNGAATWITNNTGKYLDYDGWYEAQCVDLYDFYTTGFVGGKAPMVGYADEIWNNHDRGAYMQIANNQQPRYGDVAVWGRGPGTPMSHVAIVLQDLGNGYVKTLSNNATSAGSKGASAVVTTTKAALLGYLRPRKLA
ncbi:lysin A, L-Ala-D-Glu peptidase domain [Arthrobacter phage Nellie]|uniref:Lysin A, L-Ala-D-Glu peptidase domain n=4 Tax=Jasminevirus adat TaxID=2560299 RepID=A0A249XN75_9CAUD|nr:endolysin [Arthrobacter phage Adat]ASZ72600.1 lysin A, L-Ala-D-Glu peptidase domain [Arthrobacter phage Adat]ASZ73182.1 lysin A, L-Ala-D-Glu peptidase domain [Arthrobacter phage GurgleFerb]ASZ73746.1 lysin A, L-Ala-D-Glu peptidase domain [Arthrobacter phage Nellie]AXH43716.1 lysin A, L-Ala-D-Glu peptidase domain [Arthrobacter phage Brad]